MNNCNNTSKTAIQNIKFTMLAQIIALLLSVAKSIVLPKVLTVPDYAYWQIYVLYSSYVGIFALGYNDGIYLKYGKYQYEELPLKKLRTATRFYIVMLALFSIIGFVICLSAINDPARQLAMGWVCLDIFLMGINGLLIYVLQITNQMKAYSFCSVLDKVILLACVLVICFVPNKNYSMVIIADVISKAAVSTVLILKCKEFFVGNHDDFRSAWAEFSDDIKVGINLMIANLMGMFVTGIGRMIVDFFGDISEYAYYSFGATITNLVLVFITAVSLVMYPTLKRLPENNYAHYFRKITFCLREFIYISLLLYFPAVIFIKFFLPQYTPLLEYIHFFFGTVVLQAKMQLTNNTYYKVLREERALLRANMSCVFIFLILALVSYSCTKSVYAIAVCTFVAMVFRCYASEIFIRKKLEVEIEKDMWIELATIVGYVLLLSFTPFILAAVVCLGICIYRSAVFLKDAKKYGISFDWRKRG